MTRRIATPPLEWFPYLVTTQTFSSAFSDSLPEPFAYLPEEKLHLHVFEGKASWQSNTRVLTFRGWFLSILFPVSQPVHQLSHFALIIAPYWPIICFTARGWYLSTHNRFASPANTHKKLHLLSKSYVDLKNKAIKNKKTVLSCNSI